MTDDSTNTGRRRFLVGSTSVMGAAGVVGAAVPFLGSWNPSAKARAAGAPVRVDVSRPQPGEILGPVPAWRGWPISVVRRSEEALEVLDENLDRLADPNSEDPEQPEYAANDTRSRRPDILVLVGLCPHLVCSRNAICRSRRPLSARRRYLAGRLFLPLSRIHASTWRAASIQAHRPLRNHAGAALHAMRTTMSLVSRCRSGDCGMTDMSNADYRGRQQAGLLRLRPDRSA